ncbi:MAG: hypothetical protein QNK37_36735 [Acidobacteriota bacterium]|nr:hypothetical protein [Acidobacteriota bacterium]
MTLKHLEHNIQLLESTISRMQSITQSLNQMDDQLDGVRRDLESPRL